MTTQRPYAGPCKLVLAFDVGTTYSGISYCILQPGQIPDIRGVTRFPGQSEGSGNAKVPSVLFYDDSGTVMAQGSETLERDVINQAEDHGWMRAEWWKLHLRPRHLAAGHIRDEDIPPLPSGKSAVDVLADFIKYLYSSAKEYIEEHHMGFNWTSIENSIEFIFSHPNGWEGLEQQKYREAIEGAGLIPRTPQGRARVHMVTEGEASLHYCVAGLRDGATNTRPQGIVIIDAGGGTIDLSMYTVTFNPISCREVAPAECRLQGAIFVTRRAANLLLRKLEGSRHSNTEAMDDLIRKFDQSTKLTIRRPDKDVYLMVGDVLYNNPRYNIRRGALRLSGQEATSLFDESINAITSAFDQQKKVANTNITMVFLVGGLGANDYVWSRLQAHFKGQNISVSRPGNDINKSVPNGAVLFHLDRVVSSRVARFTYGVRCYTFVDTSNPEHQRRRHQWEVGPSGQNRITDGFSIILRKGEQVDEQRETRHGFNFTHDSRAGFGNEEAHILCYRGNLSDPQWFDQDPSAFTELCTIRGNLSQAANNSAVRWGASGGSYYQVDFDVVAFFGSTELTAQMAWKDNGIEQWAPATIAYYDQDGDSEYQGTTPVSEEGYRSW